MDQAAKEQMEFLIQKLNSEIVQGTEPDKAEMEELNQLCIQAHAEREVARLAAKKPRDPRVHPVCSITISENNCFLIQRVAFDVAPRKLRLLVISSVHSISLYSFMDWISTLYIFLSFLWLLWPSLGGFATLTGVSPLLQLLPKLLAFVTHFCFPFCWPGPGCSLCRFVCVTLRPKTRPSFFPP